MGKYTLEQLALFDRCLFPDDFYKDLLKVGATELQAADLRYHLIQHRHASIVQIYQAYISSEKIVQLLDKLVGEFIKPQQHRYQNQDQAH